VLAEYVEVESGKVNERPQLAKAIAEAKKAGAVLLIAKLDRLAQNVAFIANLLETGVEVAAADLPSANRFGLHIMAAPAEEEGRMISGRTKAALTAAKARGTKLGWSIPERQEEPAQGLSDGSRGCLKSPLMLMPRTSCQ
jgi:DNA invertase Pin-like site-specific DNA recombinase